MCVQSFVQYLNVRQVKIESNFTASFNAYAQEKTATIELSAA